MMTRSKVALIGSIGVIILGAAVRTAWQTSIPADLQVALFSKILSFDRNQPSASKGIRVGVVYQPKYPASREAAEVIVAAYARASRPAAPFNALLIPYSDREQLEVDVVSRSIDVLYVSPLRAADPHGIADCAAKHDVITLTATPGYVEKGIAVGLELRGGKPHIRINLAASREQGAQLSSQLLKLAEVIER